MKFELWLLAATGLVGGASGRLRRPEGEHEHEQPDSDDAAIFRAGDDANSPPRQRGLTIHDFEDILFTEAETEYRSGDLTDDETNFLWDAASEYEWSRAVEVEEDEIAGRRSMTSRNVFAKNTASLFPFLVCAPEVQTHGVECREHIASHFGDDLSAVSNTENMTCFIASATASTAEFAPPPLVVHPFMPEAKLQQGIMDEIMHLDHLSHRLYAVFCPSRTNSTEDAERIVADITTSLVGGASSRSSRFLRLESDAHYDAATLEILRKRDRRRQLAWTSSTRPASAGNNTDMCPELFAELDAAARGGGDSFTIDLPSRDTLASSFPDATACLLRLVEHLSVRPEVCSIGMVPDMSYTNKKAQWIVQSGEDNKFPFFDRGLTGKGEVVACSDSGLDMDHCYFKDATGDVPFTRSYDLTKRKVVQYVGHADTSDDYYGHGTHVVGTILGRRSDDGNTERNGEGDGIARDAKVAFFDIGNTNSWYLDIPRSVNEIFDPGRAAGARIHSVSWGSSYNGYGYDESMFDDYMKEHEDFLVIIAAGNSGPGPNTVASPATCKNGISVGASMNGRSKGNLARFSSRGPTQDKRMKPDIVAPGEDIESAAAGTGCGLFSQDGTSMSAPVVSGTAALVRQYFKDGFYPSGRKSPNDMHPSGQLVKAVLLNGAQLLSGTQTRPYDINQNFGRVSLIDSLPLEGENTIGAKVVDRKNIRAGQVDKMVIDIDTVTGGCNAAEISVTLTWADPPAYPNCRTGSCLFNDLDVYVTKDGDSSIYFANGRTSRDTSNNAERVRVPARNGDRFAIHVEATDLVESSQNYALIVTGCIADGSTSPGNAPVAPPVPTPSPVASPVTAPVGQPVANPDDLTLQTPLSDQVQWYGNMFDVEAKSNIAVSSLSFHTDSTRDVAVEVWTKPGKALGSQYRSSKWRQVASTMVVGRGRGELTEIPSEAFEDVAMRTGEMHAFYITMNTPSMYMTRSDSAGQSFKENDYMKIFEGLASTYPFNRISRFPYKWNGAITYVPDESADEKSIYTLLDANTKYVYFGNFFEMDAVSCLSVYELEIHTSFIGDLDVTVWTKEDTYVGYEKTESAWNKVASGTIKGRGAGFWTSIPSNLFNTKVPLAAGSTQAFYVKLSEDSLLYSFGANRFENANAVIRTGAASGPEGVYSPRTANTVVHYNTC